MNFTDIKSKRISKKEFEAAGKVWPLTVSCGILIGRQRDNAIIFVDEYKNKYGVNGISLGIGFESISPIWAYDKMAGSGNNHNRKSLDDLINLGMELLEYRG